MPKLKLGAADRERLGCPELIEFSVASITNREAMALQKLGYPTPGSLAAALRDNTDGIDYSAWTAMVFLALRRAGVDVDAETLEFSIGELDWVPDEVPTPAAVKSGKAPGRAASTSSPRKRSTSTATSRRRSTNTSSDS